MQPRISGVLVEKIRNLHRSLIIHAFDEPPIYQIPFLPRPDFSKINRRKELRRQVSLAHLLAIV